MFLFIGLGNPTKEHERNRHNIGFMAVDEIARVYNFSSYKTKYQGEYAEGIIDGQKVAILKPQTYMNLSGRSAAPCINFYKFPLTQVFVFHDELDVNEGRVRIKIGGGAGGHNGIKSLDECLGDVGYYRVRMGIGHPGHKDRVHGYVLGNFSNDEQIWVDDLCALAAKNAPLLLQSRLNEFMQNVKIIFKTESTSDGI